MKIYNKKKVGGVWVMCCPICEAVQASADEYNSLPEFTNCDCDNYRNKMGKRIAELRKLKGWTQAELAERCETHQGNIARIEAGKYSTGLDLLGKIATALDAAIEINLIK